MHLQKRGRMNNIGIFTTLSNILLKILKLFKLNNINYLGGGGQRLTKKKAKWPLILLEFCVAKEKRRKRDNKKEREGEEKAELSELFYRKFILALE